MLNMLLQTEHSYLKSTDLLPLLSSLFSSSFSLFCIRRRVFSASYGTGTTRYGRDEPCLDILLFLTVCVSTAEFVV